MDPKIRNKKYLDIFASDSFVPFCFPHSLEVTIAVNLLFLTYSSSICGMTVCFKDVDKYYHTVAYDSV